MEEQTTLLDYGIKKPLDNENLWTIYTVPIFYSKIGRITTT